MFRPKSEPTDKQSILEDGFELYKQTLSLSLPYSGAIACLASIPFIFAFSPLLGRPGFYVIAGLCAITAFILSGALIFHLYCYCYGVPSNIISATKQTLLKLPTLLFLAIVYAIIILSGTMLLIIPGIILAFSLMFSFILVLTDNQTILQTLISSHRLVWGNWWHSFLIICTPLLLDVVLSLASFITIAEVSTAQQLSHFTTALLVGGVNLVLQTLLVPLILAVALVLLHDLRQRKALRHPPWN